MIYTTQELLKLGESEYSIRNKLKDSSLFLLERGIYSTTKDGSLDSFEYISKKYPEAVATGLTAFYLHNLTDSVPDTYYLATKQHSYPIRKDNIEQSYQSPDFFEIGVTSIKIDNSELKVYDYERMMIELFRLKSKYPPELYYEVLNSYRKNKDKIDYYKLNQYLKSFPNRDALAKTIMEAI